MTISFQHSGHGPPAPGQGASIFGSEFEKFENVAQLNNGSSTPASVIDATTSTKPVGEYRINFSAEVAAASGGNTAEIFFEVDGLNVASHANGPDNLTIEQKNNNDWQTLNLTVYKILAAPATIDLDIKHAAGSSTSRISNACIDIWRVS